MPYTREDAKREVENSKDWLVGLDASIKKWEQRVAGDVASYSREASCGLCFVKTNRHASCTHCPASSICAGGFLTIDTPEEILQALQKLRKELDPMDCSERCANYRPVEAERPTDHPNRIFAEDLRIGMVIRRHGTGHQHKLVVILGESDWAFAPALQLLAGHEPKKCDLALFSSGLKPCSRAHWRGGRYYYAGSWIEGAWCEQVT